MATNATGRIASGVSAALSHGFGASIVVVCIRVFAKFLGVSRKRKAVLTAEAGVIPVAIVNSARQIEIPTVSVRGQSGLSEIDSIVRLPRWNYQFLRVSQRRAARQLRRAKSGTVGNFRDSRIPAGVAQISANATAWIEPAYGNRRTRTVKEYLSRLIGVESKNNNADHLNDESSGVQFAAEILEQIAQTGFRLLKIVLCSGLIFIGHDMHSARTITLNRHIGTIQR